MALHDELPDRIWQLLPRPVLPARDHLVRLYRAAWAIASTRAIRPPASWVADGKPFVDACFSDNIFQWDSCFIVHWLKYQQGALLPREHALSLLDNFYAAQHEDGAIPREIRPDGTAEPCKTPAQESPKTPVHARHGAFTNPPLFAWAEWDYYCHTGDDSRLARVLPKLAAYFDWYTNNRSRPQGYLWYDTFGSGMDNMPRRDAWGWIDYTAQAALDCEALANIAIHVGDMSIAEACSANYLGFQELITSKMWDPWQKRFGDVDDMEIVVGANHLGLYWTLLAGVALPEQAKEMIAALRSPRHFARHHPLPTLSASDPQFAHEGAYWRGSVWAPMNYMVQRGLNRYEQRPLATEIALQHLEVMSRVYTATGTIWENYSSEKDAPGSESRRDFCGWSALGPIAGLIEDVLGIVVEGSSSRVDWRIRLDEEHGIENLQVGSAHISLRATPVVGGWSVRMLATAEVEVHIYGMVGKGIHRLAPYHPVTVRVR
ncbi:hypothetical protein GC173_12570 [bacterium]|nr:hypothetical protein [bacterium]